MSLNYTHTKVHVYNYLLYIYNCTRQKLRPVLQRKSWRRFDFIRKHCHIDMESNAEVTCSTVNIHIKDEHIKFALYIILLIQP